jgi:hypothetical protein
MITILTRTGVRHGALALRGSASRGIMKREQPRRASEGAPARWPLEVVDERLRREVGVENEEISKPATAASTVPVTTDGAAGGTTAAEAPHQVGEAEAYGRSGASPLGGEPSRYPSGIEDPADVWGSKGLGWAEHTAKADQVSSSGRSAQPR